LIALLAGLAFAADAPERATSQAFVGVNPLAPLPALAPVPLSTLGSVLANLEPGFAASGGLFLSDAHAVELRLSAGPNSARETLWGAQVYESFYLPRALGRGPKGMYVGAGVRGWTLQNDLTDVRRHNVAVAVALGDRFDLGGRVYLDARLHEILGVYTWTSDPHTDPGLGTVLDAWLPKTPVVSLDVGLYLGKRAD
jgi:hypothetical protein